MKPTYTEPEDYAYHETGHAIVGLALGGSISCYDDEPVLFIDTDDGFGETSEGYASVGGLIFAEDLIGMTLAGHVAAAIWQGAKTCPDFRDDAATYLKLVREGRADEFGAIDEIIAVRLLLALDPDATTTQLLDYYQDACIGAFTLLSDPDIWNAVRAVAEKLAADGQMTGEGFYDALPRGIKWMKYYSTGGTYIPGDAPAKIAEPVA